MDLSAFVLQQATNSSQTSKQKPKQTRAKRTSSKVITLNNEDDSEVNIQIIKSKKGFNIPIRDNFLPNSHLYKQIFQTCEKEERGTNFAIIAKERKIICLSCGYHYIAELREPIKKEEVIIPKLIQPKFNQDTIII